jgi:polysaccharide biosynthesis protein PslH
MRILFLSQLLPLPVDAGPKLRSYYVLRYLAEAGHDIVLLCFVRPDDDPRHIKELQQMCRSVETVPIARSRIKDSIYGLRSICGSTPFLILRNHLSSMERKLEEITRNHGFDALHADQLWMAPYIEQVDHQGLRVLDQHNAMVTIPRRMADVQRNPLIRTLLKGEAAKMEQYERRTCERFDHVVWVTREDLAAVESPDAKHRNIVIPIATDPSASRPIQRPGPFRVTFLGGMHWPPNAEGIDWFAKNVWPQIAESAPSSVLTIIGKNPPRKLLRTIGTRIEAPGYVPDLEPFLAETAVFVVPLLSGAGMRVKILDAWCWGIPVVSTTIGAEGMKGQHGDNLLIADDAPSFADATLRVMQSRSLADRLSENGRATVETYYDWRHLYKLWDQICH